MSSDDVTVWHRIDAALARLRPQREPLSLLVDALVVVAAWNFTYLFRLGFERWWSARPDYDPLVLAGIVVLYLGVFVALGVPRGLWRFSGFGEVQRLTIACALAGGVAAAAVLMAQLEKVPRSVLALHPVITLFGLAGVRLAYRMLYEHARARLSRAAPGTRRALVLGAGTAARTLLAGLQHQGWVIAGLLDDAPGRQGTRVAGVPVLGRLDEAAGLAARHDAGHLIIAIPSLRGAGRRRVIELATATGLPVLTVPSAQELLDGSQLSRVRDIRPEDLLGREPVRLDEAGIAECLSGKTVLITGAGGSIGAELCRQVARYGPRKLVLLELSEFNLYSIEQELQQRHPGLPLARRVGDVRRLESLRALFAAERPQIVFHAAAYKHVPLMEEDNAYSALENNTLGTWHAAQVSAEQGVERFVLISTDKAVNPSNVMGASKRAAELLLGELATRGHATKFMAVRFGNVLGSSGSVIPKFQAQIAAGGPVTVTHPDITRYFMTIPEAARLVVQAAAIGESGRVYVLDMGEPVRIVELARDMIRLAGHTPDEIAIAYTGLRPGEKLYEELLADADTALATANPRIRVARLVAEPQAVAALLGWIAAHPQAPAEAVRAALAAAVREYRPGARA